MNFAKNLHMKNKSIILKKFSTPDESSVRLFPKIKNSFSNEEFLEKYSKYFDVGEKIFSQFSLLPKKEERNLFHWIHFGFGLVKCYNDFLNEESKDESLPFFKEPEWKLFYNVMLRDYLFNLLKNKEGKIVKETKDNIYKIIFVEGVEFAVEISKAFSALLYGERLFVSSKCSEERIFSVIRSLIWKNSNQLIVRWDSVSDRIKIEDDFQGKFYPFKLCDQWSDWIKSFLEKGYSRSLLIYGPPGTGKTNLTRGICYNLGGKSAKFPDLDKMNSKTIIDVIKLLQPSCIVFDDIDRCYSNVTSEILEALGKINEIPNLVFLATANRVIELDDATIRPERFDKMIEVKTMDPEVLINIIKGDKELFEIVKDIPIASTMEIMKRIDVLGREQALKEIDDVLDRVKHMRMEDYKFGAINNE